MMQLEKVTVNKFNPFTGTARGDLLRTAYIEYGDDGEYVAIYTAHPNLRGSKDAFGLPGVVVDRTPIKYTTNDDRGKVITVGDIAGTNRVVGYQEFDDTFPGLPVTM